MKKIRSFLPNERGFTLAGALAIIAIIAIFWALTVPLWARVKQRDSEEELIFRGNEYIEAIARYHQKFGTYPPDLDTLEKLKYIRKLYPDPMTKSGKWKILHPDALVQAGQAGQINTPGERNNNLNNNNNTGLNQPGGDDDEDNDEEDLEDGEDQDQLPGMKSDEEEEEDKQGEEKETESVGPIVGVVSRSKKTSIKIYNGQDKYNKWKFVYALPQQQQPGQGGQQPPGAPKPGSPKTSPSSSGQKGGTVQNPNPFPQPNPFPKPSGGGGDDDDDDDDQL